MNEKIKNFDFNNYTRDDLSLFNDFDKVPVILYKLPVGTEIFRCRKNLNYSDAYYFEKEISYRTDLKNIKTIGRCNLLHNSLFYASIFTPEIDKPYIVSLFETSKNIRDGLNGLEFFTIGKWIIKNEIEVASIIPDTNIDLSSNININLIDGQKQFMKVNSFTSDQYEFYRLMGKEFTKVVNKKIDFEYILSATFTKIILTHPEITGLLYPSVQTKYKGYNIVFKPASVEDSLKLDSVVFGAFCIFNSFSTFFPLYFALLNDGIPFKWKKYEEPFYDNQKIIDIINKNGVENRTIIDILMEQIKRLKYE
ncbi:MAG: hypothetical protein PHT69_04680 [Bacteroidales bacterium]|nr:hypothetical protein [Bacteroidales bacterium]